MDAISRAIMTGLMRETLGGIGFGPPSDELLERVWEKFTFEFSDGELLQEHNWRLFHGPKVMGKILILFP